MKILYPLLVTMLVIALSSSFASAASVADLAKAQIIINKIDKVVQKYRKLTINLEAPASLEGAKGKYFVPFTSEGALTEWANKALQAQAGAAVGEEAGSAVGKALGAKIPFGGLMGGAAKKKGKQIGAITAIGGMPFIRYGFNTPPLAASSSRWLAMCMRIFNPGCSDEYPAGAKRQATKSRACPGDALLRIQLNVP